MCKRLKTCIFFFLIIGSLFFEPVHAQVIKGTIISKSGNPESYSRLKIGNVKYSYDAYTDKDGNFQVSVFFSSDPYNIYLVKDGNRSRIASGIRITTENPVYNGKFKTETTGESKSSSQKQSGSVASNSTSASTSTTSPSSSSSGSSSSSSTTSATTRPAPQPGTFFRPSLTVLFIDRSGGDDSRLIAQIENADFPGKYNDNSIREKRIPASAGGSEDALKAFLERKVSQEILKIWFPYNASEHHHSLDVVAERGMYNATDADVIRAKASVRGVQGLKDVGYELIDKSYILVYDVFGTSRSSYRDSWGAEYKKYSASCNLYLYQIDWNDEVINKLSSRWEDPSAISSIHFPVKKLQIVEKHSQLSPISVQCPASPSNSLYQDDNQLLASLASSIVETSDIIITQSNTDFQAQGSIYRIHPIRSKVGLKEGIKVNQRWFVYELSERRNGQIKQNRKGVIRAGKDIADNRHVATGNGDLTRFYQTYGGFLKEGMLLEQKPDFGMGITVTGGTELNFMFESFAGMERVRVYGRVGVSLIADDVYGGAGLSKEFFFLKIFSIAPFLGLAFEDENLDNIYGYGVDAGINTSLYLLHNIQLFTQVSLNTKSDILFNAGAGIRVLY